MSEETQNQDRFVMDVQPDYVVIMDTEANHTIVGRFSGPDRLLAATEALERANVGARFGRTVPDVHRPFQTTGTEPGEHRPFKVGGPLTREAAEYHWKPINWTAPSWAMASSDAHLAEHASRGIAKWAERLRLVTALAETHRLEEAALHTLAEIRVARQELGAQLTALSATLPDEKAPGVPEVTPEGETLAERYARRRKARLSPGPY